MTISGPTEARVGEVVPLTCTTASSNPPADIKWSIGGKQVRNATQRTVSASGGGWITTSNTTALIAPEQRSIVVLCHGINKQLTENIVSTHTINVLCKFYNIAIIKLVIILESFLREYSFVTLILSPSIDDLIQCPLDPPGQPMISGYSRGAHIAAGTVQKIACISSGGNPLATLTWYKNDKKVFKYSPA